MRVQKSSNNGETSRQIIQGEVWKKINSMALRLSRMQNDNTEAMLSKYSDILALLKKHSSLSRFKNERELMYTFAKRYIDNPTNACQILLQFVGRRPKGYIHSDVILIR